MRASTMMLVAFGALILGHWANNKPTWNVKLVIEMAFAVIVIALLDQGKTEPVARGFALLFVVAVLLGKNSPITGIARAAGVTNPTQPPGGGVQLV